MARNFTKLIIGYEKVGDMAIPIIRDDRGYEIPNVSAITVVARAGDLTKVTIELGVYEDVQLATTEPPQPEGEP